MCKFKKIEGGHSFLNFCRKYDIIELYETLQRRNEAFDSFDSFGYTNFAPRGTALRESGGVILFVNIV